MSGIRKDLNLKGKKYWRSLEELANTEEFQELLKHEFPENASTWDDSVDRRNFLKLMGASFALAGLTACTTQPVEQIVPYVRQPEEIIPGKPLFFATAMTLSGIATGLLVESNMGRPTKIEGNPDHPASLGATDIFAQAHLLGLYDPDRSQALTYRGNISSWSEFLTQLRKRPVEGLRILTQTVTSPTLGNQLREILKRYPDAKWHQYEPAGRDNVREGSRLAFSQYVNTIYRFDQTDVIVSLDSDFLACGPGNVRYVRDYSRQRNGNLGQRKMNRLYAIESTPTNTGAMADHRWAMRSTDVAGVAFELLAQIKGGSSSSRNWINAVARDLQQHRGSSIVIVGDQQPLELHALGHALNEALGNLGTTVLLTDSIEVNPTNQLESFKQLVADINNGEVQTLLILDGNPVYDAPSDLDFSRALSKVPLRIHLGLYDDETSNLCHWHLPQTHELETWSDARAYDGTVTILQPLIAPLYGGKSAHEVLATLSDQPQSSGYDIVRNYWKAQKPSIDFDDFWRRSLHAGIVSNSALPTRTLSVNGNITSGARPQVADSRQLELNFRTDPTIYDGRFANNGWLQELPKPITKLTWDNAALIAPSLAEKLDLENEDVVELESAGRKVKAPVWVLPGHPGDSVTIHLGYGRERAGRAGNGAGVNAYQLRTTQTMWRASALKLTKVEEDYRLATTQKHSNMEGRDLVRSATLSEFTRKPDFAPEIDRESQETLPENRSRGGHDLSLYPEYKSSGYAWGMAIDLNACVGCSACVVACQSENNIPVVGKDQVRRGREMQWLRIDRYYAGSPGDPETYFEPIPCMHCENAPCEVVCPVNATVHSSEGLNEMVYNRCVGTRYCSNNCPYKVRHFNYFLYQDWTTPSLKLMRNPDVTVRSRGVMEKCTYCVQRINSAKIEAEKADRTVRDGEIQTACQQVCPAEAIVFGNINDPNSKVARMKADPRNYGLLTELNTRPRTTYLANLRNPNPEIKE